MQEVLDVFGVVERSGWGGGFGGFLLVSWFSRIYTYNTVLELYRLALKPMYL